MYYSFFEVFVDGNLYIHIIGMSEIRRISCFTSCRMALPRPVKLFFDDFIEEVVFCEIDLVRSFVDVQVISDICRVVRVFLGGGEVQVILRVLTLLGNEESTDEEIEMNVVLLCQDVIESEFGFFTKFLCNFYPGYTRLLFFLLRIPSEEL
jgi:hypothetical protein